MPGPLYSRTNSYCPLLVVSSCSAFYQLSAFKAYDDFMFSAVVCLSVCMVSVFPHLTHITCAHVTMQLYMYVVYQQFLKVCRPNCSEFSPRQLC